MLFNELPKGAFHLKDFVNYQDQVQLRRLCRELILDFPLMQPKTKTGWDLSLKVTSWGKCGWFGEFGKYKYLDRHENGNPFPAIPDFIKSIMLKAIFECFKFDEFHAFELETVLMNWYPKNVGKLGKHQDITEQDRVSPIVTISLGDSCLFNIGSPDYSDRGIDIELKSGDVFVMGGPSRLAYHEVKKLIPGTSKLFRDGGRISLTGRKVY